MENHNRNYYTELFTGYPDIVTLPEFRKMLGGISDKAARKITRGKHVKSFYIRDTYMIPKTCVIDYVLSKHYAEYKELLKVQV